MKKRILFIGEHPFAFTGNAGMMRGLLNQVDEKEYDTCCVVVGGSIADKVKMLFVPSIASLVELTDRYDPWANSDLLNVLRKAICNIVVFVGMDIWRYAKILPEINQIAKERNIKTVFLFPYDFISLRPEIVELANLIDYPCVYSQYGLNMLDNHVKNIRYYRPELEYKDAWVPCSLDQKSSFRRKHFPMFNDDNIVFGYVGHNQYRKDPLGMLKAFSIVHKDYPKTRLYMHIESFKGVFNIEQAAKDFGIPTTAFAIKPSGGYCSVQDMANFYRCFDCLVHCTIQEGLSWVPLQAMLCGIPVIASNTTSHPELIEGAGILVDQDYPAYIPLDGINGPYHVEGKACFPENIAAAMIQFINMDESSIHHMQTEGPRVGKEWLGGVSNINDLIVEIIADEKKHRPPEGKIKKVLFAQKASAGDVLMTTRCFKGLKERHGDLELDYMTSRQYMTIVEGNPYIDNVIEWDESLIHAYEFVYNPHGERILPGHWGRNSNSTLSDFYWKILDVEPDNFYIRKEDAKIEVESDRPICVVYTQGADSQLRTYKFMDEVCVALKDRFLTIQLGGKDDFPAGAEVDMRGLTFNQEAWIVSKASLGISVDTFGAHLIGAMGVDQVSLAGSSNGYVVKPTQMNGSRLIELSPDYVKYCGGLGPCSGSIRNCSVPCMGRISPAEILEAVDEICGGKHA